MSASLGVRALAAVALIVSLGGSFHAGANAAQPDHEMRINVLGGAADRVQPFAGSIPKTFASLTFKDSRWAHASYSPCADSSWPVPQGAGPWIWASTCTDRTAAILLRRTFIIPARTLLTGRLSLAIHGVGVVLINNHLVGESTGNPVLLDVTSQLRPNGAKNVLAIAAGALSTDTGVGIAYTLQIAISANQFKAYSRTHHGSLLPPPPNVGPTTTGNNTTVNAPPGSAACAGKPPAGIVQVFTPPSSDIPFVTGWVRAIATLHIYVVTRRIDLTKINSPADMPSVQIGSNPVRANTIISDDSTGVQVLDLPFNNNIGPLSIGTPHNQAVATTVNIYGYSKAQNCLVAYTATVLKYVNQQSGTRVAQINTVPFQDGADGGVVFDGAGNLLGQLIFDPTVLDTQNNVAPLILPATTAVSNADYLIGVLNKKNVETSGEHILSVTTASDGTQGITRTDGTAGGKPTGTAAPSGTPAPSPTPHS